MTRDNNQISYEVVERIGVISENAKGWTKELSFVSWNGNAPKLDIREWAEDHGRMSKGITLTEEEMDKITDLYLLWKKSK